MTQNIERMPGGLLGMFANWSVKTKIFGGFGVILVILMISGGASYFSAGATGDQFHTYEQRVEVAELANKLDYDFVQVRRYAREYALTGDENLVPKAREMVEALGKDYGEALGDTTNTERLAWLKASTERPEHQQIVKRRRALCERGMRAAGPQATSASRGAKRQDAERRWRTACRFCHDRTV
ncbi:MAG: MCP four helix bundle domain-containing protein [Alphaproteobacteria bacterium]|nr:MCP four helix bundle domain-containing protein [Alphaproteobacteria bacterium]